VLSVSYAELAARRANEFHRVVRGYEHRHAAPARQAGTVRRFPLEWPHRRTVASRDACPAAPSDRVRMIACRPLVSLLRWDERNQPLPKSRRAASRYILRAWEDLSSSRAAPVVLAHRRGTK
jgi:hypothetical protein